MIKRLGIIAQTPGGRKATYSYANLFALLMGVFVFASCQKTMERIDSFKGDTFGNKMRIEVINTVTGAVIFEDEGNVRIVDQSTNGDVAFRVDGKRHFIYGPAIVHIYETK